MNKYKVLGVALILSVILEIVSEVKLGMVSIQYATSGTWQFLGFLSLLCVILFGSFASLTLDSMSKSQGAGDEF